MHKIILYYQKDFSKSRKRQKIFIYNTQKYLFQKKLNMLYKNIYNFKISYLLNNIACKIKT